MKKLLSILLTTAILFAEEGSNYFMDNFLKYSTFYTSVSVNSPFVAQSQWDVDVENGTFIETTKENELAYNLSIGVRKGKNRNEYVVSLVQTKLTEQNKLL